MSRTGPFLIAGVDEAGRGPLAGPVVAAAVVCEPGFDLPGLTDSKKLSASKRSTLEPQIKAVVMSWAVGIASVEEIDQINILQATMLAMQRAVAGLDTVPDEVLIDGNRVPDLSLPARYVIGGDMIEPSISAASIIAKETRDRIMLDLDAQHPEYAFVKHKGYPTPQHLHLLQQFGVSDCHRRTFGPVARLLV